jgi:hypothetical protein
MLEGLPVVVVSITFGNRRGVAAPRMQCRCPVSDCSITLNWSSLMAANPKQELHELVERLSDEDAQRLSLALHEATGAGVAPRPRPLAEADIVLATPVLPEDETADEMIETVRRWRRAGEYA